jgi:hypothetical protein
VSGRIERVAGTLLLVSAWIGGAPAGAEAGTATVFSDPFTLPVVASFLEGEGFGTAPATGPSLTSFGRLVGAWDVETEVASGEGKWTPGEPALWVWKYSDSPLAIEDLWVERAGGSLTEPQQRALRLFEPATGQWRVAWKGRWCTRGVGEGYAAGVARPGEGGVEERAAPDAEAADGVAGQWRARFEEISEERFEWTCEISTDGTKWWPAVRAHARRRLMPRTPSTVDPRAVERMEHKIGRWAFELDYLRPDGSVALTYHGTDEATWLVPGRILQVVDHLHETDARGRSWWFWDEPLQRFTLVAVGADAGELWVFRGDLSAWVITSQPRRMADGSEMQLRFTHAAIEPDSFTATMEYSLDGGATWTRASVQRLHRLS